MKLKKHETPLSRSVRRARAYKLTIANQCASYTLSSPPGKEERERFCGFRSPAIHASEIRVFRAYACFVGDAYSALQH